MQQIRARNRTSRAFRALYWAAISQIFLACGTAQIEATRPIAQGGIAVIRTNVSDAGNGRVMVTAQAAKDVVGGSFVYCLAELSQCQASSNLQNKLVLMDGQLAEIGVATRELHKIPESIDTNAIKFISISALDFQSRKAAWIQLKLNGPGLPDVTGDAQPVTPPSPILPPQPVNTSIDRFSYDRATIERASQKVSGIEYDYAYGMANFSATAPKVRAKINNQTLGSLTGKLGVVLGGYALSDSGTYVVSSTAVAYDSQGFMTLVGENLKPATIYKMRLHFFDRSDRVQSQARYLGSSSRTYNFVTDGVGDQATRIRARIVMRGLAEENDWDLGRYDTRKDYTHGAGGWCHIFYNWVITPYLKTRQGSENTHYSQSYWSGVGALTDGNSLVSVSQREPIMGDYFHVGSHAAMILAYDVAKRQFMTLEGNFNNSVEFYQRSPGGFSWVGHLNPQMIRETALQQLQ